VEDASAVLGIDLGTSQLKALVATPDGQVLGRGRAACPIDVPAGGHAETDPGAWWRAAGAAVRQALAEAGNADVTAISLAGQMHGVVLAGHDGLPVRPAILWLDRRAVAEAARYEELPQRLTDPLGNQPSPGMAGPVLCWLAEHEPGAVRQARWALQPKDWLRLRLTGHAATDPTDASGTLLFDQRRDTWASDLIAALGLPADKLPEIRQPTEVAGRLLEAPATELGLPPGIPVATGAADTAAALYAIADRDNSKRRSGRRGGSGSENEALLNLGTGGQWIVTVESFRPAEATNLFRAVGGGYYRLAASQNIGSTLDWVRKTLGIEWRDLYDTAARPWRAETPVFLPYLTAERFDGPAHGGWTGLTLAHQKTDLARAALEGVAFHLNDRLEDLRAAGHRPASVILGGGGTRHPAWRQLLADVLGLPLRPAPTSWLSPAGAALIAATATGAGPEAGESEGTGASRVRSEHGKAEVVAPGERSAASAAYGRFLTRKSRCAHNSAGPEIGVSTS
jgi:xylulokinase